ncbi:MAG: transposase [Xanthomonadales bacterium]|nr:transposase [Xanthomonadales bacterium]
MPIRFSPCRFLAKQLRGLLSAAVYVLMQELRLHARGTCCARAQISTLRERLLSSGSGIETSVRRVVLHLPMATLCRRAACPNQAGAFGGQSRRACAGAYVRPTV